MQRRTVLELFASGVFAGRFAQAAPRSGSWPADPASPFVRHELKLEGNRRTAKNALLLVPRTWRPGKELSLLVLLHGLGETRSVALGLRAWAELYGLVDAVRRLLHPPVERVGACRRCLDDEGLAALNASLERRPFRELAFVCPVTPNPHVVPPAARTLDAYAAWIDEQLLPAVGLHIPVTATTKVGIDGCSLGGYVALEVFLRRPERFSSFGMVQGAIGAAHADRIAKRIAAAIQRVGSRPVHLLTSTRDAYRRANERLSAALTRVGVAHDLEVGVGAHDQLWLREIGTILMLQWQDRQLT